MKTSEQTKLTLPREWLERMAGVLRVLAHGDRLRIVEALEHEEGLPVHAIMRRLGLAQAMASHHLTRMRAAGLLATERRGKETWYRLADPNALTILGCIRKKGART